MKVKKTKTKQNKTKTHKKKQKTKQRKEQKIHSWEQLGKRIQTGLCIL